MRSGGLNIEVLNFSNLKLKKGGESAMKKIRDYIVQNEGGVTLVEMMIAMAMLTIVIGGFYYLLNSGVEAWLSAASLAEESQSARISLATMTRDIRYASGFKAIADHSITLISPSQGDIKYELDNNQIIRTMNPNSPAKRYERELANNIQSLSFEYYDQIETKLAATSGNKDKVRRVRVTVEALVREGSTTMTAAAWARNTETMVATGALPPGGGEEEDDPDQPPETPPLEEGEVAISIWDVGGDRYLVDVNGDADFADVVEGKDDPLLQFNETSERASTDTINEADYGLDFNGDGDMTDTLTVQDLVNQYGTRN